MLQSWKYTSQERKQTGVHCASITFPLSHKTDCHQVAADVRLISENKRILIDFTQTKAKTVHKLPSSPYQAQDKKQSEKSQWYNTVRERTKFKTFSTTIVNLMLVKL